MLKKVPYVSQLGSTDCGIACLTMLFNYYGLKIDIVDVENEFHIGRDGITLGTLKKAAIHYGFSFSAYTFDSIQDTLDKCIPAILYNGSHFVVVSHIIRKKKLYCVLDPGRGKKLYKFDELIALYNKIIVVIRPTSEVKHKKAPRLSTILFSFRKTAILSVSLLLILTQIATMTVPLIEQRLIDNVSIHNSTTVAFEVLIAFAVATICVYFILNYFRQHLLLSIDVDFVKRITEKMINKLFKLDLNYFEWHSTGDTVNRFGSIENVNNLIINGVIQLCVQLVTSLVCAIMMLHYSPYMALSVIAFGLVELLIVSIVNKECREQESQYYSTYNSVKGLITEAVNSMVEIRCTGLDTTISQKIHDYTGKQYNEFAKKTVLQNVMVNITSTINLCFPLVLYIAGALLVNSGNLTIGSLVAFVTLAANFMSPITNITLLLPSFNTLKEVTLRYKELINYNENSKEGTLPLHDIDTIKIIDACYSYNRLRENATLDHVNMIIRKGQKIAIVGASGSGKSTLLKALLGSVQLNAGGILINGMDLAEINKQDIYREIAMVTQTPLCLNTSIRKNVDIACSHSDEEIWRALRYAEIESDVKEMPMGLETFIGEKGNNISGGQRQRLAIARAILTHPDVLILDEATSNLDQKTERKIFENLFSLGLSLIVVTHRLLSVKNMDTIYVLQDGQIIESGCHESLLSNNGWYSKNWNIT